jgi:hypothetical protein
MKMESEAKLNSRIIELLEKSLALQLYALGTPQTKIAKMMGKSPNWVNGFLKGLPQRAKQ